MTAGIYKIKNNITGQIYVGQSLNLKKRKYHHKNHLKRGNHHNDFLQRSFNKYGIENFSFEVLEEFDDSTPFLKDVLSDSEMYFIKWLKAFEDKRNYNLTPGGDGIDYSKLTDGQKRNQRKNISKTKNSVGYFNVFKKRSDSYKNGFTYQYQIVLNKKKYRLSSVSLRILEKKVLEAGFPWGKIFDNAEIDNQTHPFSTDIKMVSKVKNKNYKQGFYYRYKYKDDDRLKTINSVNLKKLEEKVRAKNLPWEKRL